MNERKQSLRKEIVRLPAVYSLTAYCSSQPPQGTYLIRLNFVSGNFLISHPDFIFIIFYCFYHVYRVKCLKHCKKCSVGITKKTIISVL